jgi:KDO2-lipid IV(A) lauroyltransferase
MRVDKDSFLYFLIFILTYPLRYLSYSQIRALGRFLGSLGYYTLSSYRKRALSNLALAKDLQLSPDEMIRIAKESFQNLAINCLEYPLFDAEKKLSPDIYCENPEVADALYAKGQGIIFFCAHLSNWEVLFLEGTTRMKGIAVAKPTRNKKLYHWVVSIREKYGGTIIAQSAAMREGLRALRKGYFVGIVGDQGMPSSGYSFPFLGRVAWTTTAPALLAYKTASPIIFASPKRTENGYRIHYSDPLWPDLSQPIETEAARLMDHLLRDLQERIRNNPGEWLWQHNRWKQQTPKNLYKPFRYDCICIILSEDEEILSHLSTFKEIYPLEQIILFLPQTLRSRTFSGFEEILYYRDLKETLLHDYRFKLIFNFTTYRPIKRHYLALSAFAVLGRADLEKLASPRLPVELTNNFSEIIKRALCRPGDMYHAS